MENKLINIINNEQQIVIFGYGVSGKILVEYILQINESMDIFLCDNSLKVQQEYANVHNVEETVKEHPNLKYIIANFKHYSDMKKQLLSLGIAEEKIFGKDMQDFIKELHREQERQRSITPLDKITFEVHLAEHCNLNCACCAHFSSIAKPEFCSLDQFENDMERLAFLFSGESGEIHLLGGEPLLNTDIVRYIEITRKYFPNSKIGIVTNGILLNKMEQSFWDACRINKIVLLVTQYPIKVEYDKLFQRAEKERVEYIFFRNTDNHCYMHKFTMDLQGKQDFKESFMNCGMSNNCILLKNGKLFTCSVVGNIEHFNAYFNKNLEVTETDYIDIYKANSKEEISKKLATPIPFCKYCDVKSRIFNNEWVVSRKQIDEWI